MCVVSHPRWEDIIRSVDINGLIRCHCIHDLLTTWLKPIYPLSLVFHGSSVPPVFGRTTDVLFCFSCMSASSGVQHVLTIWTIWVIWWVSHKMQKLLTSREDLDSIPVFGGVRVAHCLVFYVILFFLLCIFMTNWRGCRDRDRIAVGFITTYAISAYHH